MEKTGIDLPGEASTIMHKEENIGEVELATMAFGQSFQITPIRLAATVSALVNGGKMVTPHVATDVLDEEGNVVKHLNFPEKKGFFRKNFQDGARNSGKRRFRRVWKECVPRGIFHRRKDGNFADTSAERQPLYFLIPRLHPGGASDGAGALHYPQSAGRLLRRNDLRAGDPRYLFQCTSVSRYWTQFLGNLRIVSFAALI